MIMGNVKIDVLPKDSIQTYGVLYGPISCRPTESLLA